MQKNYILQIDTATEVCSVSLICNGALVDVLQTDQPNQHATQLTTFIDRLLSGQQIGYAQLSAVAVSKGPGSYTGLRIGVSTAKGLCYGLDIPLIAVNTLESMFYGFVQQCAGATDMDDLYFPMIDARRMEVYTAAFHADGNVSVSTHAKIVDSESFAPFHARKVHLFGSGAGKFADLFQNNDFVEVHTDFVHSSAHMCVSVWDKFQQRDFEDLIYFEPYYLKEFIVTTAKKA